MLTKRFNSVLFGIFTDEIELIMVFGYQFILKIVIYLRIDFDEKGR